MAIEMKILYLIVPLAPLAGALLAGLFGWLIGRAVLGHVLYLVFNANRGQV